MSIKKLMEEITEVVEDYKSSKFSMIHTGQVPNVDDPGLTWKLGEEKKGKIIKTCVLYVDIRNSVELVKKHQFHTMGKVYAAFTKAVLKSAHYHNGFVRNIIGDRVMIVFPSEKCFTNAVNCAFSINHVSSQIINSIFTGVEFKCGIGIDFGEMRVIKVGTEKKGIENTDNKNLVWVGYPANNASRLTDVANKEIEEEYFLVTRHPINPKAVKPLFEYLPFLESLSSSSYDPFTPLYLNTRETVKMTVEEFANSIAQYDDGSLFTSGGKNIKFEKKKRTIKYEPILISKSVYDGYKKENTQASDIVNNWWKPQSKGIKNITEDVYGSGLTWKL